MIKSVTFISIAITTFVLMLIAGVVYAYQGFIAPSPTPTEQSSSNVQTVALPLVAQPPSAAPSISPQDAASIAVKFSNRSDLYSVELADFNGSQTYKVTFSSGDVIYVDLTGQVVGSTPPSQAVLASPTATKPAPAIVYTGPIKKHPTAGHGGGSGGGASSGGGGDGGGDNGGGDN